VAYDENEAKIRFYFLFAEEVGAMGKVEENKQLKRERLLDTAFSLFTTKGLTKTSISDIVNNAGVAKGTFYLYFKDKYDIANKLIVSKARFVYLQALERLEQQELTDPADRIIFLVDDILNQFQRTKMLLRFINKNLSWGIFKNAMRRGSENHEEEMEALFRRILGEDLGQWRELDAMIYLIVEMVGSSCYSVILDKDPMPLEDFKPILYRSIRAVVKSFQISGNKD
jgi:AcrR family transcriptional regulator